MPSITQSLHHFITKPLLRFFLPWACAGCRAALPDIEDHGFCGRCWLEIPRIQGLVCYSCGIPLPDGGKTCFSCRKTPMKITVRAAAEYKGPLPPAIYRFKYFGRRSMAVSFGTLLRSALDYYPELQPLSHLAAVPLHASRQRMRGYNQAELLAQALSTAAGLPLLHGILVRRRQTAPQYGLRKPERLKNLKAAFAAPHRPGIKGLNILLIDDICTTGATLQECAKVLRRAGAASVKALVLARDL
jgi:ComF family protein